LIRRVEQTERMSRAVVANGFVFLSGLTALDKSRDIIGQTTDVLDRIQKLLIASGSSREGLISATIWLNDVKDFDRMNEAWEAWFKGVAPPARATVESKLALPGALIEIMAQALVRE
jgi:enamine deaminase RidA (YjgF/YER057c/UK114 family)